MEPYAARASTFLLQEECSGEDTADALKQDAPAETLKTPKIQNSDNGNGNYENTAVVEDFRFPRVWGLSRSGRDLSWVWGWVEGFRVSEKDALEAQPSRITIFSRRRCWGIRDSRKVAAGM